MLEDLIVPGLLALYTLAGGAFSFWLIRRQRRQSLGGWREAAASCGLQVVDTGPPLRARTGALEVRLDGSGSRDQDTQLAVVVPGPPDFYQVRIRPEAAHPYQYQWTPEIETGDAQFDRTFRIEGPAPLVLALLDARARQFLLGANGEGRVEIALGEIRSVTSSEKLNYVLSCLLEVGRKFAQPMDVFQRVAENAGRDPAAGVRLQNLLLLVREIPGNPLTLRTLRAACADPSPQVRLWAARERGADGRDLLLAFAESEEDDTLSAGAVSILGRELPVERATDILIRALARHRPLTARACVETLGCDNDPEAGVRLQNLLFLTHQSPGKYPTLMALREACSDPAPEIRLRAAVALGRVALDKACSDPAPEVRLRAAMALGGDRRDVLIELAESLEDDTVGAEAVSALDRALPFERRRTILGQALKRGRVQTARACLEAFGRNGNPAAVDVLAEVLERESGKIAAAAALALGATGEAAAEPPLILALQREDTQVAAADALARTGTAAAVLPLEEAAERSPEDKDLHRAVRQAIAQIQSRLQGASPGQLSLAGGEAGQLSLAQSEAGQLSLATDHSAGQLSLAPEPSPPEGIGANLPSIGRSTSR